MDPVRPPTRLAGVASSWLDEIDPTIWLLRPEIVEVVSSFTTRPQVGLMHRESKGLFQVHRWPREDSTAFGHTPLSLRAIADRHADPNWTFRFLWYNTWLLYPPLGISSKPLIEHRRREIGQAIARRPYQIAALCEVWNEDERKSTTGHYR